ncbi:MAG TPA: hypothetical protein VHC70_09710 [Phycisphaerales bacterium]|jgi:hypothetical protein|nr:hypothetical protein [Phycisphaerales bacterium]
MARKPSRLDGFRILRVERGKKTVFIAEKDGRSAEIAIDCPAKLTPEIIATAEKTVVAHWHALRDLERWSEEQDDPLARRR